MLTARFAAMVMRRIHVSDPDLEMMEEACRRVAQLYRNDGEKQENPLIRGRQLESAEKFERIAERMKRFREASD
jgi:hypothetical protein